MDGRSGKIKTREKRDTDENARSKPGNAKDRTKLRPQRRRKVKEKRENQKKKHWRNTKDEECRKIQQITNKEGAEKRMMRATI